MNHQTPGKAFCWIAMVLGLFHFWMVTGITYSKEQKKTFQVEDHAPVIAEFSRGTPSSSQIARTIQDQYDGKLRYVYTSVVQGISIEVPSENLGSFLKDHRFSHLSHVRRMRFVSTKRDRESSTFTRAVKTQDVPVGMKRIHADEVTDYTPHEDIDIAVLDTGIDGDHPDLQKNVKGGINVTNEGKKSNWGDGHTHGTHVAGIIAAQDNNRGVVGVAPKANLYSVRVLNSEGRSGEDSVVKGIDWVGTKNFDIANLSLGGLALPRLIGTDTMGRAVRNLVDQGTAVVVAAGNESLPAKTSIPAGYEEVASVTAINPRNDQFAEFSNYSWNQLTTVIAAPGVGVRSTVSDQVDGQYQKFYGTSMAAPHVAGAMALLLAEHPSLTPEELENVLINEGENVDWNNHPQNDPEPLVHAARAADGKLDPEDKEDPVSFWDRFFNIFTDVLFFLF